MKHQNTFIKANECSIYVTEAINPHSEFIVIVLHGGPGSGADPLLSLPAFQELEEHFSMLYFDQRGSGKSNYNLLQGLTMEQVTEDIKAVVDYCKDTYREKQIYLWGGSFGGLLGLLFLKRYPTAVGKAVLSSPAINLSAGEFADIAVQMFLGEEAPFTKEMQQEITMLSKELQGKKRLQAIYELPIFINWFQENPIPQKGAENFWHIYAMREWLLECDMTSSIKDIQIPTLFLMGIEDPIIPSQLLVQGIRDYTNPNVTLETFSPCGHAVFEDCKEEFCEKCITFYKRYNTIDR